MGAVDFMFTPSVQRVLALTLTQPDRSFTLAELLRQAASGRGSTQQQIDRLVDAGVLIEEPRRGRQRSIRANTAYFLYAELRSIALKTFGLAEPIRQALAPHAAGIEQAFVFGSVAKASDTGASDIDVIVVGLVPHLAMFEVSAQLQGQLGRTVHFTLYEPAEWQELVKNDPVVAQIAAGIKLQVLPDAQTR